MVLKLRFTTLDVFATTRFLGNPLAIVHLPDKVHLSQSQKLLITKEFNLSETVFLHESSDPNSPISIDIFTPGRELPFAGHPTVGSGWYLLSHAPEKNTITLRTKAGDIPVIRDAHRVSLQVPIDFKVHAPFTEKGVKGLQPDLQSNDYANGIDGPEAIASVVKGMSFILLQLTSEEALARLRAYPSPFEADSHLGEWAGLVAVYGFFEHGDGVVRTRMFYGLMEDPATGAAASTLGGYLAKRKGEGKWRIEILQGVEMGRNSEITVDVEVGGDNEIVRIELGGAAVEVMDGWVHVE